MEELRKKLEAIGNDSLEKVVFSIPKTKQAVYLRAKMRPLGEKWQLERFSVTQAFHENFSEDEVMEKIAVLLEEEFNGSTVFTSTAEWNIKISKKGKLLVHKQVRKAGKADVAEGKTAGHNLQKKYIFAEGKPIGPLVDMGIFTPSGQVAAKMYDKYRQVNRFAELVEDMLRKNPMKKIRVVDFGCGKSALTFVLYHYLKEIAGLEVEMTGLDLKAEVVENCTKAAQKYGYEGLTFQVGDIQGYKTDKPIDMVVTLHACDIATDLALAHAIEWKAKWIFSVPCCQHEVNSQIESDEFALLLRYGLLKERFSALLTDGIRANLLEACGYKTQVLEFVDFAHTPKNVLLRGVRTNLPLSKRKEAYKEVSRMVEEFKLKPTLLGLLLEKGILAGEIID